MTATGVNYDDVQININNVLNHISNINEALSTNLGAPVLIHNTATNSTGSHTFSTGINIRNYKVIVFSIIDTNDGNVFKEYWIPVTEWFAINSSGYRLQVDGMTDSYMTLKPSGDTAFSINSVKNMTLQRIYALP